MIFTAPYEKTDNWLCGAALIFAVKQKNVEKFFFKKKFFRLEKHSQVVSA